MPLDIHTRVHSSCAPVSVLIFAPVCIVRSKENGHIPSNM